MTEKALWSKKCPKCGHPALQHKLGKPGEPDGIVVVGGVRYCHHPVPAGVKDYFGFCLCEIREGDYVRAGNHALIRVSPKQAMTTKS